MSEPRDLGAPESGDRPWWVVEDETSRLRELQTAMEGASLAVARRLGLGLTDVSAMSHLAGARAAVGPGWLSQRLGVTPAAATELVDRLERAGHLTRQRDTVDRRRVRLQPTDSALTAVGAELRPLLTRLDEVAADFSEAERDTIRRFLDAMISSYADFAEDPPAER